MPATLARRTNFARVLHAWTSLSAADKNAWRMLANNLQEPDRVGRRRAISGRALFLRLAIYNLAALTTTAFPLHRGQAFAGFPLLTAVSWTSSQGFGLAASLDDTTSRQVYWYASAHSAPSRRLNGRTGNSSAPSPGQQAPREHTSTTTPADSTSPPASRPASGRRSPVSTSPCARSSTHAPRIPSFFTDRNRHRARSLKQAIHAKSAYYVVNIIIVIRHPLHTHYAQSPPLLTFSTCFDTIHLWITPTHEENMLMSTPTRKIAADTPKPFNVLLDNETRERLDEIASAEKLTRGQAIRAAITLRYMMNHMGIPMCASGQRCLVPHLHPAPAVKAPSVLQTPTKTNQQEIPS